MTLRASIRQWSYPAELRIYPAADVAQLSDDLISIKEMLQALTSESAPADASSPQDDSMPNWIRAATSIWRLEKTLGGLQPSAAGSDMRWIHRHAEGIKDAIQAAGFDIRDHTREVIPSGGAYFLKVVAYEPTPDIEQEIVIETIKPTIYFRSKIVQTGEVIVGTPIEFQANP